MSYGTSPLGLNSGRGGGGYDELLKKGFTFHANSEAAASPRIDSDFMSPYS